MAASRTGRPQQVVLDLNIRIAENTLQRAMDGAFAPVVPAACAVVKNLARVGGMNLFFRKRFRQRLEYLLFRMEYRIETFSGQTSDFIRPNHFPVGFGGAAVYYYFHKPGFRQNKGSVNYTLSPSGQGGKILKAQQTVVDATEREKIAYPCTYSDIGLLQLQNCLFYTLHGGFKFAHAGRVGDTEAVRGTKCRAGNGSNMRLSQQVLAEIV